jgi:hypothetical protein
VGAATNLPETNSLTGKRATRETDFRRIAARRGGADPMRGEKDDKNEQNE